MSLRDRLQIKLAKARGGMVSEVPGACWSLGFVQEVKFDGIRESLEIAKKPGANILQGRNKHGKLKGVEHSKAQDYCRHSDVCPHLRDLHLPELAGTILDGEVVWGDDSALAMSNAARGLQTYFVFDCLFWKGLDIRGRSWQVRRELLERAVRLAASPFVVSSMLSPATEEMHEALMLEGHEGTILKDRHGIYGTGTYGEGWWKAKAEATVDVVIMGISQAKRGGSPKNGVKAQPVEALATITVGMYDDEGALVEVGKCRFPPAKRELAEQVWKTFKDYEGMAVEMQASGYNDKRYRWCEFVRFRPDKPPLECVLPLEKAVCSDG